ncbi:hypothetical protein PQ478_08980 [Alkalihalophilus pseudofirmus]|uniref:hypothetical protein n=1 Tax=Alkalihalophilus pseudofirmus TaxID=79885 RepID=UPI00259AF608|nr:hypothetical protein [Alkalihalophilus pseudofirmus]WEG18604.1 hypothetical protein PQ478_08980 [Alkalihalophilus pseudofirmus]
MDKNKLALLKEEAIERNQEISEIFTIGGKVKCDSDSYDDIPKGSKGTVLKKTYSEYGCDLRVYFENLDIETWIDAGDMSSIDYI